jgi:predicted nucleic acid-binding OB-fold protein
MRFWRKVFEDLLKGLKKKKKPKLVIAKRLIAEIYRNMQLGRVIL